MTDLAKLVVRLEAQTAQYMAQLDKANKRLEKFDKQAEASAGRIAKGVAAAASAAAVAFGAMVLQAVAAADDMGKLAQSSGIAVESLSQLEYAASLSGSSLDELVMGMNRLTKSAADAARGSKTAADAFKAIGVSVKNSDGSLKNTEQLMLEVADRFAQIEDGAGKAAIAQELFGKSGTKLIPFLNQGKAGIEALKKEADALGLTITGNTSKAAEEFNDNLDRIRFAAKGLANQAASELLPVFGDMAERFIASAQAGGAMDFAIKALSVTLKTLVTTGVIVTSVFEQLGRIVYGAGAAIVRLRQGEFRLAAGEIKDAFADVRDNVAGDMETIAKVWGDSVPKLEETAKGMDDALKGSIVFNDDKAKEEAEKAAKAALESLQSLAQGLQQQVDTYGMAESAVIRYRIAQGDLAEEIAKAGAAAGPYVEQIIRLTDESMRLADETRRAEKQQKAMNDALSRGDEVTRAMLTPQEQYAESIMELNDLLDQGAIKQETYNRAVEAAQKKLIDATKESNKFLEEATRNVQDIIADNLINGFDKGAKGILKAFADMIVQLTAQAVAADLAGRLFGSGGVGSGGGWIGAAMSAIGAFGGTRDSGGRGRPGMAYAIGTGAQPEMFVPDTSGTFVPKDQWMGGGDTINMNFNIEAPGGRVSLETQQQIATRAAQSLEQARRRNG